MNFAILTFLTSQENKAEEQIKDETVNQPPCGQRTSPNQTPPDFLCNPPTEAFIGPVHPDTLFLVIG